MLRSRIGRKPKLEPAGGTEDGRLPLLTGRHPDTPVGCESDVVAEKRCASRGDEPRSPDVGDIDDRDAGGGRAETDPQPTSRTVDRHVPRPTAEPELAERPPGRNVDRDDSTRARIGHERVHAVGVRRDVPRLDEAVEGVPDVVPVDDRDDAGSGVTNDGIRADLLDRARVGRCGDRTHNPKRTEIDEREARLGIARDECVRLGRSAGLPLAKREGRDGSQGDELAAVHANSTFRLRGEVRKTCSVPHPELESEQEYVDRAYTHLERMRSLVARATDAVDGEVAQAAMDAWAARRLKTFADAERGLVFGRLDFEQLARPIYLGRRWVHDEELQQVVVNWQAPAARPFYTATPQDPHGVKLRRRFRTDGRRLLDLSDEALDGSIVDGAAVGDFLLEELERTREQHMQDIVATIQADQYRLITRDPATPLVIQGGPGTGKTAVGLHRASWLLYTHRETIARRGVLVVGPNPTFMEYVSHVLPALGEEAVEQRAVSELLDGIETTLTDPPAVVELKSDLRLVDVIRRAAQARLVSEPEELAIRLEGSFVWVREREIRGLVNAAREELGLTAAARERFRMNLLRRLYEEYGRVLGAYAVRSFDDVERALRGGGYLDRVVKAAWPQVAPDRLIRTLYTSRTALAEASDSILTTEEQKLLARRGTGWSDADVPLLDEARSLLAAPPHRYGHVIVDEAQDLSPMQLRMLARRAPDGGLTILGDVAQGTGAVAYSSWEEVLPHLPHGDEAAVEELRHAYRVPREIMEVALPLLDTIAPDVAPPIAYRTGAEPPTVHRVEQHDLLAAAYREAERLAGEDGLLAVIAPDELAAQFEPEGLWDGVPVLTPRRAKGLEFDHVVVVEPALIADGDQGLRALYVSLTRPTKTLVVVHSRPLPAELRATS